MKKILICLLLLVIYTNSSFTQGINFQNLELDKAYELAQKEDKKVMFLVYMNMDGFARMMEKTYEDAAVAEFYNKHFICIKKGVDRDEQGLAFMKKMGIVASPAYLFFEPIMQEEIHRHQGRTATPEEFIEVGKVAAADFCTNLVEIIKDYPNGFENIMGEENFTSEVGVGYESKIQLPEIVNMSIFRALNKEKTGLKKGVVSGALTTVLPTEKALEQLSAWALVFAACDLSFIEAKDVSVLKNGEGANAYESFAFIGTNEKYTGLYFHFKLERIYFDEEKKNHCRLFFEIGDLSEK